MNQSSRDSGPLHHAAVHVVVICLFGWVSLVGVEQRHGGAGGGMETEGSGRGQTGQLLKIRLNDASASELKLLPSIGASMADRMLRYRQRHGDFESWSDLQKIVGMGPSTIHTIRPYCELDGAAETSGRHGSR